MIAKLHALHPVLACALGLSVLASCSDPFHPGIPPQTGGSVGTGGGSGSGGTPGTGGTPSGGTGGTPIAGTGGSPPTGGAGGGGNADGGPAAVDARKGRVDAGPVLASRRCVPLPEPDPVEGLNCPLNGIADLAGWFPRTPPLMGGSCFPQPHPADECPFYRPTFQQFMIATQPDATGKPFFLTWRTLETTFTAAHRNDTIPTVPVIEDGITQAGGRRILIDANGNPIYYGIHMNPIFVDFVKEFGLDAGIDAVKAADPQLEIPEGAVTTKEAWMVVTGTPPANFITTPAKVPTFHLTMVGGVVDVVQDNTMMRDVTLQLIGIHVVHTLPGHPEMIWGTFQHRTPAGDLDIAPTTDGKNELDLTAVVDVLPGVTYALWPTGSTKATANAGRPTAMLMFNEAMQTFTTQQVTPVYRLYPASKSHTSDEDEAITKLNTNVKDAFAAYLTATPAMAATDRRGNYQFIGATWQDVPQISFATNVKLVNDETIPGIQLNGGDDPLSITGGEDRLSGVALESFTQGVNSFASCFKCHDTRSASKAGVPSAEDTNPALMEPKKIAVSHIFNEVVRLNLK
jgi:hypothetical protein